METPVPYQEVWHEHSDTFGLKILVAVNRRLSDGERLELYRSANSLSAAIQSENLRVDPRVSEARRAERENIIALFRSLIFVEEIPNGYCNQWCCTQKPWFVVTTPRGRIQIGWRKRVISIDWSGSSISETADTLFPDEDVTKSGRLIHAWGYDKAREYLARLLQ